MLQALDFQNSEICTLKHFPSFHFFTTTSAGNMSARWGNEKDVARKTIQIFNQQNVSTDACISMLPEPEDHIIQVETGTQQIFSCSGLLSKDPKTVLLLRPADCLPILMTTREKKFIGLIHAGWSGSHADIARKAVQQITTEYDVDPKEILIGIGPAIHRCCYNNEHVARGLLKHEKWHPFIHQGPLGTQIDLVDYNVKQLLDSGIVHEHISVAAYCTCCATRGGKYMFFSHHRTQKNETEKEGRFLVAIGF